MSLADVLAFPKHRRSKSAPGILDEVHDPSQFARMQRRARQRRLKAQLGNRIINNNNNHHQEHAGEGGQGNDPKAQPPHNDASVGCKENVPSPSAAGAAITAVSPAAGARAQAQPPHAATAQRPRRNTRRRVPTARRRSANAVHHDRSLTMAATLRLPTLDDGAFLPRAAPSEQPLLLYTAPKGSRLGGLAIAHEDEDGVTAAVFFNDKRNGNIYQAPSPHDRGLDTDLMRSFAKTSGRPNGMVAVRGVDDQIRVLVADRLRKAILVAGENTFDVMIDRRPATAAAISTAVLGGPRNAAPGAVADDLGRARSRSGSGGSGGW